MLSNDNRKMDRNTTLVVFGRKECPKTHKCSTESLCEQRLLIGCVKLDLETRPNVLTV